MAQQTQTSPAPSAPGSAEDQARIAAVLWRDPRPIALVVGTECRTIGSEHGLTVAGLLDYWAATGHINREQNERVSALLIELQRSIEALRTA